MALMQILDPNGHKVLILGVAEGSPGPDLPPGFAMAPDDGTPLWQAPADMPDITDGQFGRGLWEDGVIPYEEYIGFVGAGILPSTLEALLAGLPDDDTGRPTHRKIARGDLMGRTRFIFANPLVETIRQLMAKQDPKWTPAYLRGRWRVWADL